MSRRELIRVENTNASINGIPILHEISLNAYEGERIAVFGFSGSGKSTLLRMLAGIQKTDCGKITTSTPQIAFSMQSPILDNLLTPLEILSLQTVLCGIPKDKRFAAARESLRFVNLYEKRNSRISTFSDGERKLLEIARALVTDAELFFLDEPMSNLDLTMRRKIWERLYRMRTNENKTIIIATSRPEDAELCDRIILLDKGRIIATGTMPQLRSMAEPEIFLIKPVKVEKPHGKTAWSGILGKDHNDFLEVEVGANENSIDLISEIADDISAIRIKSLSLDVILQKITAPDTQIKP